VARAVKTAFDDMIVPGLDFVAKQAKLDGVKAAAVAAIGGVKTKVVDPRLRQFLTALVNKLKAAIGIQPGESTQQAGQIGPRVERMVQGVKYQLWVAARGGQTVIMVARQGGPKPAGGGRAPNQSTPESGGVELERLELTEKLLKDLSPQARAQVQAAVAEVRTGADKALALLKQKDNETQSATLQSPGGVIGAANSRLLRCLDESGVLGKMYYSGACFAAGTPMRTVDGSVPIEQLRPGDYILSRNELDPEGPVCARQVEEVFVRQGYVLDLRVNGQLIRTTEEQPFYRAGDGWVAAWELRPGDQLVGQGGALLRVESVTQTGIVETVYNVRVADWHTYFVGGDEWGFSVWAHNACLYRAITEADLAEYLDPAATHINPRGIGGKIIDQIQGPRKSGVAATKYISASETYAGTARFRTIGVIEFDSDKLIAAGSGIVHHANVLTEARNKGDREDVENVITAQEVLITHGIPKSAITRLIP
ncbi:MAG: polymorphic toxin-type HINT domain-containing protein, partial [Gemmataceae bacterium]